MSYGGPEASLVGRTHGLQMGAPVIPLSDGEAGTEAEPGVHAQRW